MIHEIVTFFFEIHSLYPARPLSCPAKAIYHIDFLGFLLLKNLAEINSGNTNIKTEAGF